MYMYVYIYIYIHVLRFSLQTSNALSTTGILEIKISIFTCLPSSNFEQTCIHKNLNFTANI